MLELSEPVLRWFRGHLGDTTSEDWNLRAVATFPPCGGDRSLARQRHGTSPASRINPILQAQGGLSDCAQTTKAVGGRRKLYVDPAHGPAVPTSRLLMPVTTHNTLVAEITVQDGLPMPVPPSSVQAPQLTPL